MFTGDSALLSPSSEMNAIVAFVWFVCSKRLAQIAPLSLFHKMMFYLQKKKQQHKLEEKISSTGSSVPHYKPNLTLVGMLFVVFGATPTPDTPLMGVGPQVSSNKRE